MEKRQYKYIVNFTFAMHERKFSLYHLGKLKWFKEMKVDIEETTTILISK